MNKSKLRLVILSFFLCFLSFGQNIFAQGSSNKGTDFWLGYGKHTSVGNMVLYITSDVNTTSTVTIPALGFSLTVPVVANTVVPVDIPTTAHLNVDGLSQNGIHVTALKPIIVYAHIYDRAVSGATLVLPVNTLGKDYYSINYTQISNSKGAVSWFFVVAVEDNTTLEITPSGDTQGGWQANTVHLVTLNKGQIYNVLGNSTDIGSNSSGVDLTGSRIKSISSNGTCKKIAVFSGSSKIAINCLGYNFTGANPGSADNLFQQVYPTATWGKNFITVPEKERNFVIYRILKSDASAMVKLNGVAVNFTNNFYYDFASQQVDEISSDKPIQVVQYAVTQGKSITCGTQSGDVGDPEMIFLNPLEQTLTKITMYSTPRYLIIKHFINVVIKNEGVASFKLDGVNAAGNFIIVPNNSLYSYAQISVAEGTHNLSSDVGFNAIAYGFGNAESYGYAAGANLTSFGIDPVKIGTTSTSVSVGCVGTPYDLNLKLPYKPLDIQLDKFDGAGFKIINVTDPPLSQDTKDRVTTYIYSLIPNITYSKDSTYTYKVRTTKPSADDDCGTGDEFTYDFIINPKPTSSFTAPEKSCLNNEVSFVHQPDAVESSITDYLWDFNGEATSILKDPKFTFKTIGVKKIKFSSKNNLGCWSDVFVKDLNVVQLPISKFKLSTPSCETKTINFTDQSTTTDGSINQWTWDFGDPISPNNSSTIQNPIHIFSTAKTYDVSLTITTDLGCMQTIVQQITIQPTPIPNFDTPNICLDEALAQFKNTTTISDNSTITYQWDFGDPTSTTNTSVLPNPSHRYLASANYNVKLTVTSAAGCMMDISKVFTVNGSTPKSAFTIQNDMKLCSNQIISFGDHSTIDFGQITRIDLYFDDLTPTIVETDNQPGKRPLNSGDVAKIYTHQYPVFYSPAQRDIIVKMITYSGNSSTCTSIITKPITIYAAPKVEFNALTSVCQNVDPFQIVVNETTRLIGSGKFSGDGVDVNGMFSPILAGVGTHPLTYTYLTDAGCSDSKSQDITVFSVPLVNAGIDHTILIGGGVPLNGESTGENLTYKWTPSIGLDHDDILNPIASPTKDTPYTLTVTNSNGCQGVGKVFVKVLQYPEIPNTFTPNGDGVNDTWSIKYLDSYPSSTIKIFNRYGIDVFKANRYTEPWDGRLNGVDLPTGTYYYIITANNGSLKYTGSVLLIR